jgi:hypothetical protein
MRIYLVWHKDELSCAVMDVTKVVEDAYILSPELPRAIIASSLCGMMGASEIITADTEEEMMESFMEKDVDMKKEGLH